MKRDASWLPGEHCDGCNRRIDANEDAFVRDGKHWCSEECRRGARLVEAEQLAIGEVRR